MGTSFSQKECICSSCDRAEPPKKSNIRERLIKSDLSEQYINDAISAPTSSSDNEDSHQMEVEESEKEIIPNMPPMLDMDSKTVELLLSVSTNFTPTHTQTNDVDITYPTIPIVNEKETEIKQPNVIIEEVISPTNVMDDDDTDIENEHVSADEVEKEMLEKTKMDTVLIRGGTERLKEVTKVSDMAELHDTMRSLYDTDDDESEESDHSSLDENELKEIERLKAETASKLKKPTHPFQKNRAFRMDTSNPWEEEEIDETYNEMEQQLIAMKQNSASIDITLDTPKSAGTPVYSPMTPNHGSNSRSRGMSHLIGSDLTTKDLDDDLLKQHKEEMKRHMMHLVQQSNAHLLNLDEIADNIEQD